MASTIKGITVEINGETTGLQKALSDVNKRTKDINSELKQVNNLLKLDPNNITLVAQKQELLKQAVEETSSKLNTLKDAQSQVEQQFKNGDIGAEQYRAFQRELEATQSKLENLKDQQKNVSVIGAAFDSVKEKVSELTGKLEPVVTGLQKVGSAAASITGAGISTVSSAVEIAAKGLTAYTAAAAAATTALGTAVIGSYGELEQNLGGSEAVFGEYAENIQKTGEEAYKNLGVSQSEYLATANKMGALFQGSGVEQEQALDLTTKAMQRAADMASVMGIDTSAAMEAVTGAAKGNYTMMDNLGVKMSDTSVQAYAMANGLKGAWSEASDAEKAQYAMQMFFDSTEQYAGNFAKESTQTISGSIGLVQASVSSLIAGLGNANADITNLAGNVVDAFKAAAANIAPVIENITNSIPSVINTVLSETSKMVPQITTAITGKLPSMITNILSGFNAVIISVASAISETLPTATSSILPVLLDGFWGLVDGLIDVVPDMVPSVVDGAIQLFTGLMDGLNEVIPQLMSMLPELITNIGNTLYDNLPTIIKSGVQILTSLIQGVTNSIPALITQVAALIPVIVSALTSPSGITALISAGIALIVALAQGLPQAIPAVIAAIPQIITAIITAFMEQDWAQIGIDIMLGIGTGIIEGVKELANTIKAAASSVLSAAKSAFGINSPSKLFRDEIGTYLAEGLGVGFTDEMANVSKQMKEAIPTNFNVGVGANVNGVASDTSTANSTSNEPITVNYTAGNIIIQGNADALTVDKIKSMIRQEQNSFIGNLSRHAQTHKA